MVSSMKQKDAAENTARRWEETADSMSACQPEQAITYSSARRLGYVALALTALVPLYLGVSSTGPAVLGAEAGVIQERRGPLLDVESNMLVRRDDSPADVCTRWAHQSAIVNGTLYVYGGQATTTARQTENTWNNNFLSIDLTNTWQISSPSMVGLPQPSGPPNVSLGSLWNSHDSLYLYGGEFSWKPDVDPTAFSLWEYKIASGEWHEHSNPKTEPGANAENGTQAVERVAEGAGISVPSLGRAWYFGGHQDSYTTKGWSKSTWRIYVKSLIEYTFPGYKNKQVTALSDGKTAGADGAWRNVTQGGLQEEAGFPERADGLLLYVPGFGTDGILLGLAGGTNDTLTQMNVIDVYDIFTSNWYKQATSGPMPRTRVNPCAVVAAAPDGSSYNVYMFGGQNLQPAGDQTQLDDMWILTIPSFTWIEVDQKNQAVPYSRAGHTCHIWDGQMITVGGYVGTELSCDSPGIYVYDLSSLTWVEQFTAISGSTSKDTSSDAKPSGSSAEATATAGSADPKPSTGSDSGSDTIPNPFSQQKAQIFNNTSPGGLEGSYGYQVPKVIISVIGGGSTGGASVTEPKVTATRGPLATGKPITYTVTQPNGAASTETSTSGSGSKGSSGSSGPNIAAIVAGTIAGLLFLLACYLAFCAWLYRKQLILYKQHVEMSQRQALGEKKPTIPGLVASNGGSTQGGSSGHGTRGNTAGASQSGSGSGSGGRGNWGHARNGSGADSLLRRMSSESGPPEDLIAGHEPTFLGVMLAPRQSLRVINL